MVMEPVKRVGNVVCFGRCMGPAQGLAIALLEAHAMNQTPCVDKA